VGHTDFLFLAQRLSRLESGLKSGLFAVFRRFLMYKNCFVGHKINLAGLFRPDQQLLFVKK
jgi:hypothetical protein